MAKILIIDDSEIVLEMTQYILESAGHQVLTKDTPFGGFAAIIRDNPDLVLLDLSMPGMDGELLAEIIQEQRQYMASKIVFYSDRSEEELKILIQEAGVIGYIKKTHDAEKLLKAVEQFL